MKSVFISTKLRTTDDLDWAGPLKNYLAKIYGNSIDFTKESGILNKLRLDLTNSLNDPSNHFKTKDIYYKYYGQLELLDLRLPIQEHGVRVKFRWYDAYHNSTHHSQHSLAFEKASVLFNLAAILSSIGAEKFLEGDYKTSYQNFQYSAGVYKFMTENFLHAPSHDLNAKTSHFLESLQLAQAQEVFLLKLISEDSSKKSLIAKLAYSSSLHYKQTLDLLEKLDGSFGEIVSWTNMLGFKTSFYRNVAYYNYASSIEEKKIGEAITFLRIALEGFGTLKKYVNDTTIDYKSYQSLIEEKMRVLIKDNDFIYHDTIPTKESLDLETAIKPLDAAKPISIDEHPNIGDLIGEDIFEKVIPANVHEKLSFYSEEKAKLLREELDKVETTDIELTSFLEYLRLPSSLNDFKNNNENKLDPKLIDWSTEISTSNLNNIDENISKIKAKREEILKLIKDLEGQLDKEEADYNVFRAQGNSQEPSSSQSINLRDDLTGAKQSLLSASKLDSQIYEKIAPEITNLNNLKSTHLLEADFCSQNGQESESLLDLDDSVNLNLTDSIKEIEKCLRNLNDLKKSRSDTIDGLKSAIQEDDISNILILNNKTLNEKDEKLLFEKELIKFRPFITKIDANILDQRALLENVKINYNNIISSNTKITKNVSKVSRYEKTFKMFKEYEVNYNKAVVFYSNLLNYVHEVKINIEKFIYDRNSQRQRLKSSSQSISSDNFLRDRFSNLSVSSQSPRGLFADNSPSNPSPQLNQQRQQSFSSDRSIPQTFTQPTPPPYTQPTSQLSYNSPAAQQYQSPYPYSQPLAPQQQQNQQSYGQPLFYQQPLAPSHTPQDRNYPTAGVPPLPPKAQSQQQYGYPTQGSSYSASTLQSQPSNSYSTPYDPNRPYP